MITTTKASDLKRDELRELQSWCDCQRESLWNDLGAQTILNLWHASSEWETLEAWLQEAPEASALHQAILNAGDIADNRVWVLDDESSRCQLGDCNRTAVIAGHFEGSMRCSDHATLDQVLDAEAQHAERYASTILSVLANRAHFETFASKDRLAIEAGRNALIAVAGHLRVMSAAAAQLAQRRIEDVYRRAKRGMK